MNFQEALTAMQNGEQVYRTSWMQSGSPVGEGTQTRIIPFTLAIWAKGPRKVIIQTTQAGRVANYEFNAGGDASTDLLADDWAIVTV